MVLNFNRKIIISVVSTVLLLLAAASYTTYTISHSSLEFIGKEFIGSMVKDLYDTIEMQNSITQEKLHADLGVLEREIKKNGSFYLSDKDSFETTIVNQVTKQKEKVTIPALKIGIGGFGEKVNDNFTLVDETQALVGGTATIFQVLPGKLLRVTTNVRKLDGKRAVGTYIPDSSPVYKTVMSGETFRGKAFVVNDWYVTAYKPMKDFNGNVVAVIYVGRKMMTEQLRNVLSKMKYDSNGAASIALSSGKYAYHEDESVLRNNSLKEAPYGENLLNVKDAFFSYTKDGTDRIAYAKYFEPWDWHIMFSLPKKQLYLGADNKLLQTAGLVMLAGGIISIILFSFLIKMLLRPVVQLSEATRKIADGDLDAKCDYDGNDAIGETVASVNDMVSELKNKLGFAQGVLNGIPTPCGIVGPDFNMIWVNKQVCTMLEKTEPPDSYVGLRSGQFYWNDPSRETLSDKAIKQEKQISNMSTITTPSGKELHIDVSTTPFYDLDGKLLGSISFWHDLTQVKESEMRVKSQNEAIARTANAATEIANQVSAGAMQLAAQISEATDSSMQQSARMEESATAIEEMNATTLEVAQNASMAAENAESARHTAEGGADVVQGVIASTEEVQKHSEQMSGTLQRLGEQAEGIGRIIGVINDIADQTNLLALNAAIEAARAGEAGRGFAVVADEVRKLAEKTMDATKEVEQVVSGIQSSTSSTLTHMKEVSNLVAKSTEQTHTAGGALNEIVQSVLDTADRVRSIATAAEQQSATSEEISQTSEEIKNLTNEMSQTMEQSSQAVNEMAQLAQDLMRLIEELSHHSDD